MATNEFGDVIQEPETNEFGDPIGVAVAEPPRRTDAELMNDYITSGKSILELVPQEQAGFAGSILNSLENPSDTEAKTTNAIYLADMFDVDVGTAMSFHDQLSEAMLNSKDVKAIDMLKEIRTYEVRRKSVTETLVDSYHTSGIRMVKSLAGLVQAAGERRELQEKRIGKGLGLDSDLNIQNKLAEWGKIMNEASQLYLDEHPEEASQIIPGKGFFGTAKQHLQRPETVLQGTVEAIPMLLEAYLGHITGTAGAKYAQWGQKLLPWMGRVQGIAAPIFGERYGDLRRTGTPPEMALPQAFLTAQGEGIIEEWTLGQKVKAFQGAGLAARKGIAETSARILWGGSKAFVRGTAEEATQRLNDNFWNMIFSDPDQKLFEGVFEDAATGGFVETAMGGGFAAAGGISGSFQSRLTADEKVARAEAVREVLKDADLSVKEKADINTEIDRVIENTQEGREPTQDEVIEGEAAAEEVVTPEPAVEKPVAEVTTPDQSLVDERRGIIAVDQKQRTPQQIERLAEIETELVERNLERFPQKDITDKERKSQIKDVEADIQENAAFQIVAEGQEDMPQLPLVFSVSKGEMTEIKERFEGRTELLKRFKIAKGGSRIDNVAQEIAGRGREALEIVDAPSFNEMLDIIERSVEAETGVTAGTIQEALESGDEDLQMLALKHELLTEGETAAIINEELIDLAGQLEVPQERLNELLVQTKGVTEEQRRAEILKEVTKEKPKKKVKKPEQDAIRKATKRAFKENAPIFVVSKADGKFSVTKRRPTKGEFVRVTPPQPGELEGKTERLQAGPTAEEVAESKKLKQQINIVAKNKGFTKKKFDQIKMDNGGTKKLTRMTIEELRDVLKATKRARPKIVNKKTVVTPKTERQIAALRENLTRSELMNDEEFDRILAEETGGKLPKYISEKAFITQSQGRKVLAHMHDSAEKLRATESLNRAIAANDEILIENEKLKPVPNVIGAKNPNRLLSMRYFIQRMAERTDTQLYHIWQDLTNAHQSLTRKRRKTLDEIESTKGFTEIAKDKEALQRVSDYVASQSNLKNKPKAPKDITDNERTLARKIQVIYKDYELHARIGKFFQHIDDVKMIPQYQQHKKAIDKALDIYNTEGLDALFDYMQTQPWGIVRSGYEPTESTIRGIKTHELPLIAVPKTHIKERGIEYNTQERNILQRTDSYMRQMDFLAFLQPKIKSLVRSSNEVLDQFETPADISQAISTYIDNVKKTNNEDGLVEQVMRKIYSQAITTLVLADPTKPARNLLQNAAFAQDKADFINPDNKQLTEDESEYLETFVHQDRVMLSDWAFTGEEAFYFPVIGQQRLGLDKVTKWVQRNTQYPASDRINRTWSFWAKVNRVKRAFAKKQSLAKKMQEARFSDMQKQEQQMALGILARDGVGSMARYIAKVHTDNTHFLYAREQRSPAEQTKLGRLILNLALFKRAALEKATLQVQKAATEGDTAQQRFGAAEVLATLVASAIITNLLWKKFTGKEVGAYDFINFLQFDAGGLELNATEKITEIYNTMLDATKGDAAALSGLSVSIPQAADTFIPFYDLGLRFIEASLGAENIDRVPLRRLREMIDSEYKTRGISEVERSLVEKLQFVAFKSKPKKDKKKSKPKPFTPR